MLVLINVAVGLTQQHFADIQAVLLTLHSQTRATQLHEINSLPWRTHYKSRVNGIFSSSILVLSLAHVMQYHLWMSVKMSVCSHWSSSLHNVWDDTQKSNKNHNHSHNMAPKRYGCIQYDTCEISFFFGCLRFVSLFHLYEAAGRAHSLCIYKCRLVRTLC